jgi:hypothetical protein
VGLGYKVIRGSDSSFGSAEGRNQKNTTVLSGQPMHSNIASIGRPRHAKPWSWMIRQPQGLIGADDFDI